MAQNKGSVCHNPTIKARGSRMLNCFLNHVSMQCTLLIPHLWRPRDAGGDACRDLVLPELQTLLARSRRRSFAALGTEAWLLQAFEVERQRDWPVAPLTLALDGGDPGDAYWLRADPVHLRPHHDHLVLADSSVFRISRHEADALADTLNRHFAAEGMQFCAPHPERWYLRLEADPQIATSALGDAAGGNVNLFLPTGKNALRWHRIWNEIQMLLHDHAVNETREARGEPAINSVWLWGGGRTPAVPGHHFSAVWSDDPLALALAANTGIPGAPTAADGERWLETLRETTRAGDHHLLVFGQLTRAARYGDASAWRDDLAELNGKWFAPLLAALRQRRITRLALVVPAGTSCERFEVARQDLFKFWRTARPLAAYLPVLPR